MTQLNICYHCTDPSYISISMEVVQYWQIAASIKRVNHVFNQGCDGGFTVRGVLWFPTRKWWEVLSQNMLHHAFVGNKHKKFYDVHLWCPLLLKLCSFGFLAADEFLDNNLLYTWILICVFCFCCSRFIASCWYVRVYLLNLFISLDLNTSTTSVKLIVTTPVKRNTLHK